MPGWIVIGDSKIEVVISDLTERGARADASRRFDLPADLIVRIPTLGLDRKARVAWRKAASFGLEFLP